MPCFDPLPPYALGIATFVCFDDFCGLFLSFLLVWWVFCQWRPRRFAKCDVPVVPVVDKQTSGFYDLIHARESCHPVVRVQQTGLEIGLASKGVCYSPW